jgi:hypothetical protein
MAQLQIQYEDTGTGITINCFIANSQGKMMVGASDHVDFSIYPNPSHGIFDLINSSSNTGVLRVINQLGLPVAERSVDDFNIKLDLRFLPRGMYFIEYLNGASTKVRKIIIE